MKNNRPVTSGCLHAWRRHASWITKIRKDLERNNIKESKTVERNRFNNKRLNLEGFQSRRNKKSGTTWTQEGKRDHGEKIGNNNKGRRGTEVVNVILVGKYDCKKTKHRGSERKRERGKGGSDRGREMGTRIFNSAVECRGHRIMPTPPWYKACVLSAKSSHNASKLFALRRVVLSLGVRTRCSVCFTMFFVLSM